MFYSNKKYNVTMLLYNLSQLPELLLIKILKYTQYFSDHGPIKTELNRYGIISLKINKNYFETKKKL